MNLDKWGIVAEVKGSHHQSRVIWAYLVMGMAVEIETGYVGRHRKEQGNA